MRGGHVLEEDRRLDLAFDMQQHVENAEQQAGTMDLDPVREQTDVAADAIGDALGRCAVARALVIIAGVGPDPEKPSYGSEHRQAPAAGGLLRRPPKDYS